MKIRRGNANKDPSLIVGVPYEVKTHIGLSEGDDVYWNLNQDGSATLRKLGVKQ
jgi:bifunctional DNA-binding transcriptional regulator/antitoxin component of YhaV-PrlF toxin-antitoxin module